MNYTVIRAIEELRISQTMRIRPSEEVDAIIAEMEGWDIDAETKRADAAEAKVCELVEHIRRTEEALADGESPDGVWIPRENLPPRFSSTADIRAKWVPKKEHDLIVDGIYETRNHANGAQLAKTEAERNSAEQKLIEAMGMLFGLANPTAEWPPPKELMSASISGWAEVVQRDVAIAQHERNSATRERDEVGVQLVAAQERLALAMETVDALSMTCLMWSRPDKIKEAKADVMFVRGSLDAVPGDEIKKGGE